MFLEYNLIVSVKVVNSSPSYPLYNVLKTLGLERLEVGTVHMCFSSVCGYRPLINPNPVPRKSILLDITLCSTLFGCRFFVIFRVRVRVRVSYRVTV